QHRQRPADRDRRPRRQGPGGRRHRRPAARAHRAARVARRQLPGRAPPRARPDEGAPPARLRAAGIAGRGPAEDPRVAPRPPPGGRRGRMSAPAASVGAAAGDNPRPLLHAVDRSDATLMSIGTLASGVLAYAFNVLAARSLGPAGYGAIGALWGGMFLLAVLLFRPIEQTISRAVADHVARGEDGRGVLRSAAGLTLLVTSTALLGIVLAWTPITDRLFGGNEVLTVALMAGLAGYGLSYFVRGVVGGV